MIVNGEARSLPSEPGRSLLYALREELGLTGTKYGCGEGECGACTILLDGQPALACQLKVKEVEHRKVTTVEGLSVGGLLNPVQRAFAELGAFQCGYCTPGMVVRATALLAESPRPSRSEICEALEGNLCRCCGYAAIVRAVERAGELAGETSGRR
ncbi:MAG: (2Fe-2S)-binding protein [Thermoplasmata archaeon]|nr:(2Fe-2S)-binding protein [Thermoplasmata archaeon]